MLLALEQIIVPPGHQLLLKNVSWQQFQDILENLGSPGVMLINFINISPLIPWL